MSHPDYVGQPEGAGSRLGRWLFLALIAVALLCAAILAGSPIAQSHGDDRAHALSAICLFLAIGTMYLCLRWRALELGSWADWLLLLFPVYVALQAVPLPLALVRLLSPTRAQLVTALKNVMAPPEWVSLSVFPSATFYHFLVYATCLVVFFVVRDLCDRFRDAWVIALPLVFAGAGEAILGLIQAAQPGAVATGTFAIRNHFAGFLEMTLPFAALYSFRALAARESGGLLPVIRACGAIALGALMFAGVLASLSRMGFVASVVSLVLVFILAIPGAWSRRRKLLVGATAVVAGVLVVVVVPSTQLLLRFGEVEMTGEDRTPVWHESLGLIRACPVFGCGAGGYESAFLPFKRSNSALNQDYAHNDYLQYLAELGIVGFLLALVPLGVIGLRLWQAGRASRGEARWLSLACTGSMVAIAIHSFVDFNLYVPANLFTFAWVFGIAAYAGASANWQPRAGVDPAAIIAAPPITLRSKSYL